MEIRLEGVQQLLAKLESIRANTSGSALRKALRAGGRAIEREMESRAPILDVRTQNSTALPPGALRAGIRVYAPPAAVPATALIGPNAKVQHVARWVEYGHRLVKGGQSRVGANGKVRGAGTVIGFVPPQPFLRPGFEAGIEPARVAIVESLQQSLKEQVG